MNKLRYRLVFNKKRGSLMAVAETATSCGKGRQTGTRAAQDSDASSITPKRILRAFFVKAVSFACMVTTGLQPVMVSAQVIAAGAAGSTRPTVDTTANGIPLVNITTPSAAGVSHNQYNQFNVGTNGVILNNSPTLVQTQQGGWINGNANVTTPARVILNEVTGTGASSLRGYTEVAGQRAEVIIANPNGILCDGCGFINTSRGVLTTGVPVMNNGSLESFRVTGGQLQIGSGGLYGSNTDQIDLIARSVQVNGQLWANTLNVIAGANQVNYADLGVQVIQGDANKPTVGIDVAALGGMYANKIRLVGTEAGVGVANAGQIAAQAGDLTIDNQGHVTLSGTTSAQGNLRITTNDALQNSGQLGSSGTATLQANSIDNSGAVASQNQLNVQSSTSLTNSGSMVAQGNLNANAATVNNTGTFGAGIDANGKATQAASLNIQASGAITSSGKNIAGADITMQGSSLNLSSSQIVSTGNTTLTATSGDLTLQGANLQASGNAFLTATQNLANSGSVVAQGNLNVNAATLQNTGTLAAGIDATGQATQAGNLNLQTTGAQTNSGTNIAGSAITMQGTSLNLNGSQNNSVGTTTISATAGDLILGTAKAQAGGEMHLSATQALQNNGVLTSQSNLTAQAATMNNTGTFGAGIDASGKAANAGSLSLQTTGVMTNSGTNIAGKDILVSGTAVDLSNATLNSIGNTTLTATSGDLTLTHTSLQTGGAAALSATQNLTNSGTLTAQGDLSLTANTIQNTGVLGAGIDANGKATQAGSLSVQAINSVTDSGVHVSGKDISVTGNSVNLSGAQSNSVGNTTLTANTGDIQLQGSSIQSSGNTVISAAQIVNNTGNVIAQGNVSVNGANVQNSGTLAAGIDANGRATQAGSLNIQSSGSVTNSGTNIAGDALTMQGTSLDLSNSKSSGKDTSITATSGDLTLKNASVQSSGNATLAAAQKFSSDGSIVAQGNIAVTAATINNTGTLAAGIDATGKASQPGNLNLQATGTIINSGTNVAGGDVTMLGTQLNLANAQTYGGSNVGLTATSGDIVHTNATTQAGNTATLNATGKIDNTKGQIGASNAVNIAASTADNTQGMISTITGDINVTLPGALTNTGGTVHGGQDVNLTVNNLVGDGTVFAERDANLKLQGDYTQTAGNTIAANRDLNLTTTGNLTNQGTLEAFGTVNLAATNITNQDNAVINGQTTIIKATDTVTNTGRIFGDDIAIGAQTLTNNASAGVWGNPTGVIAARNSMNIGVTTLNNLNGSWLYAENGMSIGGGLDATNQATGSATTVNNPSSTIETGSNGDLKLSALTVNNTNAHFATEQRVTNTQSVTQYMPDGSTVVYAPGELHAGSCQDGIDCWIVNATGVQVQDYTVRNFTSTTTNTFVTQSVPGQILVGRNLVLADPNGVINNDKSRIIVGGSLTGNASQINNIEATGQQITTDIGTDTHTWTEWMGRKKGRVRHWDAPSTYAPAPNVQSTTLSVTQQQFNTAPSISTNPASSLIPTIGSAGNATAATQTVVNALISNVAGSAVSSVAATVAPTAQNNTSSRVTGTLPSTLPSSRLYTLHTDPGAHYLVETDPKFANYRNFISSDYMLTRLNLDPATAEKRLGDGFYEQQLINQQVNQLTGRKYLEGYTNAEAEYKALMDAGIAVAKPFNLTPGIALTDAQIAALTYDIVWLVEKSYTLPDGTVQKVLVPQVYLTRSEVGDLRTDGTLISATNIDLKLNGSLQNSGTLLAQNNLSIQVNDAPQVKGLLQNSGQIIARTGDITLSSSGDLISNGSIIAAGKKAPDGTLTGGHVALLAGNDLTIASSTIDTKSGENTRTGIGRIATVQANSLYASAGNDLTVAGAQITTTGDANLSAVRDINLNAVTTKSQVTSGNANETNRSIRTEGQSTAVTTSISSGGNLNLSAGQDFNSQGAQAKAVSDVGIQAGRDVNIGTAQNTQSLTQNIANETKGESGLTPFSTTYKTISNTTRNTTNNVGSAISGNNVAIQTGQDATISGSSVSATKALQVSAGRDLIVTSAEDTTSATSFLDASSKQLLGKKSTQITTTSDTTTQVGSRLSGGTVDLVANNNLTIQASKVQSKGDTNIIAGNELNIIAGTNTTADTSQTVYRDNRLGIGNLIGGGFVVSDGKVMSNGRERSNLDGTTDNGTRTAAISELNIGGNLNTQSGGNTRIQAANITANTATIQAGSINGTVINPDAKVFMEGAIESSHASNTESSRSFVWQNQVAQGDNTETIKLPTIKTVTQTSQVPDGNGGFKTVQNSGLQIVAPNGVVVQATQLGDTLQEALKKSKVVPITSNDGNSASGQTVTVDLQATAQEMAKQPGLEWLGDLAKRKDVDWKRIELARQSWNEDHGGLTQEGGIVVAIAIAILTWGAGTAAAGALEVGAATTTTTVAAEGATVAAEGAAVTGTGAAITTTTVGATGAVTTTTVATTAATTTTVTTVGANAVAIGEALGVSATTVANVSTAVLGEGITTLSTQAAISAINNHGNVGAILNDLGSSQNLRILVASMMTAGVGAAFPASEGLSSIATRTAAGCASGELTGQGCQRGATTAGILSTAAVAYQSTVGYAATLAPGENRPSVTTGTSEYVPDPVTHQQVPADQGMNVIGLNAPSGLAAQQGPISRVLNLVPGINATAGLHDYIFNGNAWMDSNFTYFNIPTMLPAAVVSITAGIGNNSTLSSWLINRPQYIFPTRIPPQPPPLSSTPVAPSIAPESIPAQPTGVGK